MTVKINAMTNDLSDTVILAIPGTRGTKEVPRIEVIEAIRRGEISTDNWVWSPSHNDWKQVSELPDLNPPLPSALMSAPEFLNRKIPSTPVALPQVARASVVVKAATAIPKVSPQPRQVSVAVPQAVQGNSAAQTRYSKPMEVKDEFPIFKVLFFFIFLILSSVVATNYFFVEQPFAANLATTDYGTVPAYAHLGGFVQPDALVIHIPPNTALNAANLADFIATLARSTLLNRLIPSHSEARALLLPGKVSIS